MLKLRWEAKATKRELALQGLKRAVECAEQAAVGGGATCYGRNSWYLRSMYHARAAVDLLSQTDGYRKE